jgi:hypothetical protein
MTNFDSKENGERVREHFSVYSNFLNEKIEFFEKRLDNTSVTSQTELSDQSEDYLSTDDDDMKDTQSTEGGKSSVATGQQRTCLVSVVPSISKSQPSFASNLVVSLIMSCGSPEEAHRRGLIVSEKYFRDVDVLSVVSGTWVDPKHIGQTKSAIPTTYSGCSALTQQMEEFGKSENTTGTQ